MTTWDKFLQWFAASPIASWLRVFVAIVLGAAVADWAELGGFDFSNWQVWLLAGAVSVLPMIIRWLNPQDGAFGRMALVKKAGKK
jgi:hypothetical protein